MLHETPKYQVVGTLDTIGVEEIMHAANIGALGTFRTMDIYMLRAIFYFRICYPLSKFVGFL